MKNETETEQAKPNLVNAQTQSTVHNADDVGEALEVIKAVAHVGLDFGYGEYELQPEIINTARKIYEGKTLTNSAAKDAAIRDMGRMLKGVQEQLKHKKAEGFNRLYPALIPCIDYTLRQYADVIKGVVKEAEKPDPLAGSPCGLVGV